MSVSSVSLADNPLTKFNKINRRGAASLRRKARALVVAAAAGAGTFHALSASAANVTWSFNTDSFWSHANWSSGAVSVSPANGDLLIFGSAGLGGTTLTNDLADDALTVNGMTFNSGAAAFTL